MLAEIRVKVAEGMGLKPNLLSFITLKFKDKVKRGLIRIDVLDLLCG